MAAIVAAVLVALVCVQASPRAEEAGEHDFGLGQTAAALGNGFLVYCHCMGRFGNQVDHLLGAMAWAKRMNRTLVIPPFIFYDRGATTFRPFTSLFELAAVQEQQPAIDMETFMSQMAPSVWPLSKRYVFCISQSDPVECRAKQGNPPATFWNHFHIDFVEQKSLQHLYYGSDAFAWQQHFPSDRYPVLATTNAPGPYPVEPSNRHLQRFLRWVPAIANEVAAYQARKLPRPWVAIHLRAGSDWETACKHADQQASFMSSPQCVIPAGVITRAICLPAVEDSVSSIVSALQATGARTVFVGTDNPSFADKVAAAVAKKIKDKVAFERHPSDDAVLDLAIFAEADFFIGNCVSSFTAFAKRARDSAKRPSAFFGLPS